MPRGKFFVSEANNLKKIKKIKFNFIFCNSIFQYFLKKICRSSFKRNIDLKTIKNKIYILDIPDHKRKQNM